jgi:hypothetical protein
MNIKRGAFRLWVVVTVLWVGLVGWSLAETFPGAWREGCFHDDGIWWAPAAHKTPLKPGDFMPPGVDDWEDATPCMLQGDWPSKTIPRALVNAVALPGGLLVIWLVGGWVRRGFAASKAVSAQ